MYSHMRRASSTPCTFNVLHGACRMGVAEALAGDTLSLGLRSCHFDEPPCCVCGGGMFMTFRASLRRSDRAKPRMLDIRRTQLCIFAAARMRRAPKRLFVQNHPLF